MFGENQISFTDRVETKSAECQGCKEEMKAPTTCSDNVLALDAFVRAVGIKKNTPHALFLGAGASITSDIPSAGMCIWEWKRDIFLTNNPGLEDQFAELSLPSVKKTYSELARRPRGIPDCRGGRGVQSLHREVLSTCRESPIILSDEGAGC